MRTERIIGLGVLAVLGLIMLIAEADNAVMFMLTKVIGIGLWALVAKLFNKWNSKEKQ